MLAILRVVALVVVAIILFLVTVWLIFTDLALSVFSLMPPHVTYPPEPPPPPPSVIKTIDSHTAAEMQHLFPHVTRQLVGGGNVNISEPLHWMGGGPDAHGGEIKGAWYLYMQDLTDGRIGYSYPRPVEAIELFPGDSPASFCDEGNEGYIYPELRYPLYCREEISSPESARTPQVALSVLPVGYTDKLRSFARVHGERDGWLLASMIAGLQYARHLRSEMDVMGIQWPMGVPQTEPFNYCIAGVSVRAVFPPEVTEADIRPLFPALDIFASKPDIRPEASYDAFLMGYRTGVPAGCQGAVL